MSDTLMLYDWIQDRGPKVVKMANLNAYLFRWYACNQKLTVNYDTSKQYLNFNWTDFLYSGFIGSLRSP